MSQCEKFDSVKECVENEELITKLGECEDVNFKNTETHKEENVQIQRKTPPVKIFIHVAIKKYEN